jgi:hypothetical protein
VERNSNRVQTPPSTSSAPPPQKPIGSNLAATVRPSLSFANAAAKKDQYSKGEEDLEDETPSHASQDIANLAL